MIDRKHDLSLKGQCQLHQISRSSLYYQPRPISDEDLDLIRLIDELHLSKPFMGARMLRD
jgi:putative transposase